MKAGKGGKERLNRYHEVPPRVLNKTPHRLVKMRSWGATNEMEPDPGSLVQIAHPQVTGVMRGGHNGRTAHFWACDWGRSEVWRLDAGLAKLEKQCVPIA